MNSNGNLRKLWNIMRSWFENPSLKVNPGELTFCHSTVYNHCSWDPEGHNSHMLHNETREFFQSHLNPILEVWDTLNGAENIVYFYVEQWKNYKISSKHLDAVFRHFNHTVIGHPWALFETNESHNLARLMWKQLIFENRREQLTNAILTLIDCRRKGVKMLCYSSIRIALESYLDEQPNLETYQQHFEQQFLQGTRLYYSNHSAICIEKQALLQYIKEVTLLESTTEPLVTDVASINWQKCLQTERELITQCLPNTTLTSVMDFFEDILIQTNYHKLCSVFLQLLSEEKADYLQYLGTLYKIMARLDDSLEKIMEYFITYVESQCTNVLMEFGKCTWNSPITTVTTILDIHRKYSKVVVEAFGNDCRFLENLDTICLKTIRDERTTRWPLSSQGFGEDLALYCDSLLRKSKRNLEEADVDEALGNSVRLFYYMGVEDVASFKKVYTEKLFDRLAPRESVSNPAETAIFNKLEGIGEYVYSKELRVVYQEIMTSKSVSQELSIHHEKKNFTLALDFQVYTFIPDARKSEESLAVSLPSQLDNAVKECDKFFKERHSRKNLTWQHHLSHGVIVSNCYKKKFEFQASTFQMVVLLMYNSEDSYCMQALADGTGLPMRKLVQVVESLIKAKLLVSSDPTRKVAAETVVSYREDYANQKRRVNINISHHTNY